MVLLESCSGLSIYRSDASEKHLILLPGPPVNTVRNSDLRAADFLVSLVSQKGSSWNYILLYLVIQIQNQTTQGIYGAANSWSSRRFLPNSEEKVHIGTLRGARNVLIDIHSQTRRVESLLQFILGHPMFVGDGMLMLRQESVSLLQVDHVGNNQDTSGLKVGGENARDAFNGGKVMISRSTLYSG